LQSVAVALVVDGTAVVVAVVASYMRLLLIYQQGRTQ
jgi:hypothetical protein